MDPNDVPDVGGWANPGGLDDDAWNPDWDEFVLINWDESVIDWPHPLPQPSADHAIDCDWTKWEDVWQDALEASQISEPLQVVVPLATARVLER